MIRELERMAAETHEVLVVGGGIQGVSIAREAARRGLRTALLEADDFGAATSMNSQRMIHGGVRYLQNFDFARMRRSVLDRRDWMREFPDLIRPVPILLPTIPGKGKPTALVRAGMLLYELLNVDRSAGLSERLRIPGHRTLSKRAAQAACPALGGLAFDGAILFHDAIVQDSERLTFAVAERAWYEGARLANHARAVDWIRVDGRVRGAVVVDGIGGGTFEVRAERVVFAGGPWAARDVGLVRAMGLLTRAVDAEHAIAIPCRRVNRLLFLTPWRGFTFVGVDEAPHEGAPDRPHVERADIERFLGDVNAALPGAGLTFADVHRVFAGLLPVAEDDPTTLAREDRIIEDDDGLMRILGVKYTTAPSLARRVIDQLASGFGRETRRPAQGEGPPFSEDDADPRGSEILLESPRVDASDVVRAVRREMALTLADIALRRTPLAMCGLPAAGALERTAGVAGEFLGWDDARRRREIDDVRSHFDLCAAP